MSDQSICTTCGGACGMDACNATPEEIKAQALAEFQAAMGGAEKAAPIAPPTLLDAAAWCDEEYRRLCMLPPKNPRSYETQLLIGQRAALADLAAGLRSWAKTGKPPEHQKVRDEWRIPFERQAREDERLLEKP